MWCKNVNELVSTHGYSLNQVIIWKYPTMQKLAALTGHSYRVLYLAGSPDGKRTGLLVSNSLQQYLHRGYIIQVPL